MCRELFDLKDARLFCCLKPEANVQLHRSRSGSWSIAKKDAARSMPWLLSSPCRFEFCIGSGAGQYGYSSRDNNGR